MLAHPDRTGISVSGIAARTKKKPDTLLNVGLVNNPGSDLLSHALTHAVPSAETGLTSVFGMGTGVTLLL